MTVRAVRGRRPASAASQLALPFDEPRQVAETRPLPVGTVRVVLRPVAHRPGFYRAELGGECLTISRQPFYDTARVLIGRGAPPDTVLEVWHAGGVAAAMRATVGEAAKWTVEETDRGGLRRREWRPFAAGAGCPPTHDEAEPVAGGPPPVSARPRRPRPGTATPVPAGSSTCLVQELSP